MVFFLASIAVHMKPEESYARHAGYDVHGKLTSVKVIRDGGHYVSIHQASHPVPHRFFPLAEKPFDPVIINGCDAVQKNPLS
jgi:hypothetical protein